MSVKQPDAHDARSPMKPTVLREYAALVKRVRSAVSEDREASLFFMRSWQRAGPMSSCESSWESGAPRRVLLSAGIHGDELAGVEALCEWLETQAYVKFLQRWDITMLPCINPWGYQHGTRENGEGMI